MNDPRFDITVVGAGAAGLAAAIFAAEAAPGLAVAALDGAPRVGAKILISGGGRCNVTHAAVGPRDFCGSPAFVRHVLAAFGVEQTQAWFASMGVPLERERTGKLFPASGKARTVVDALLARAAARGVALRTGARVATVTPRPDGGFEVATSSGPVATRRVVLAAGGRSVPKTGSDGSGYAIARALGHSVTATFPALVPLVLGDGFFHASLSGLSCEVAVATRVDGRVADRRAGSLLWTHFGVSGPAVMDASRFWTGARAAGREAAIEVSFRPGRNDEDTDRLIRNEAAARPPRGVGRLMGALLPERLGLALARHAGVDPDLPLSRLSREGRRALVRALTALELPVVRDRGWNYAEVTAGGVPLEEVDFRTMASRRTPGLYLAGEILDCDGRIGGFNFQWAWATGHVAGRAAARF